MHTVDCKLFKCKEKNENILNNFDNLDLYTIITILDRTVLIFDPCFML